MSSSAPSGGWFSRLQLLNAERLNRPERIVLLTIVGVIVCVDVFGIVASPDLDRVNAIVGIVMTLSILLYIWSPALATSALATAVGLSFLVESAYSAMAAASIAAGLVMRLGSRALILAYIGGFVALNIVFGVLYSERALTPANIAIYFTVAVISGGVGLALRASYARGRHLERELEEQAEREREAVLAERRWIAGELHDSIAHHLTIVALHVQMLDDDARAGSQEAIRGAARKALSDLRFVIELAEDSSAHESGVPSGDLAEAIAEAREECAAAGHTTVCDGDPRDERLPRGVEIILARVVRESTTNILKYAGPGEVRFVLDIGDESITLEIRSPLPTVPRRDLSSTGTGLNRMAERVLGVKGDFSAGPGDGCWIVAAELPTV